MGFRTVVVLSNDRAHEWEHDPELGRKISLAAAMSWSNLDRRMQRDYLPYGEIVEQVHADTQTVAFLDGYGGKAVAHSFWYRGQDENAKNLALLKVLADNLGYKVVKKPTKEKV